MKNLLSLTPLLVCAAFATAATVASAGADEAPPTTEFAFKFSYDPAELQDSAKAEILLARLEHSVRRHCDANQKAPVAKHGFIKDCIDETMKDSMGKFGSSTLTQVYQSRAAG